jgi:hypothetical protein
MYDPVTVKPEQTFLPGKPHITETVLFNVNNFAVSVDEFGEIEKTGVDVVAFTNDRRQVRAQNFKRKKGQENNQCLFE